MYSFINLGNVVEFFKDQFNDFQSFTSPIDIHFEFNVVLEYLFHVLLLSSVVVLNFIYTKHH